MLGSILSRQLRGAAKALRAERRFQKRATRVSTLVRFGFRPAPVRDPDASFRQCDVPNGRDPSIRRCRELRTTQLPNDHASARFPPRPRRAASEFSVVVSLLSCQPAPSGAVHADNMGSPGCTPDPCALRRTPPSRARARRLRIRSVPLKGTGCRSVRQAAHRAPARRRLFDFLVAAARGHRSEGAHKVDTFATVDVRGRRPFEREKCGAWLQGTYAASGCPASAPDDPIRTTVKRPVAARLLSIDGLRCGPQRS